MGLKEKSLICFSLNEIDSAATHHLRMRRQGYSLDESPLYHRDTQKGQTPALTDNLELPISLIRTSWDRGRKLHGTHTERTWTLQEGSPGSSGLAQVADAFLPLLYISTYAAAVLGSVTVGARW